MDYSKLFNTDPKPPKKGASEDEDLPAVAQRIVQEHIDYLKSSEWAEKSGGYDPTPLIEDLNKAEFIFDPDKFVRRPDDPKNLKKLTRVVRSPSGRVIVNVNPNQIMAGEKVDVEDLLYHEIGHIAYPNFGQATPEITQQRMAMLENQKAYQALMEDQEKPGQYFRDNIAPLLQGLAKGEITPEEYKEKSSELEAEMKSAMTKGDLKERTIMRVINNAMRVNRVVPAHEIRQKIIEQRMGGNKRLEKEGVYDKGVLERLINEVAQQEQSGYSSLFA